MISFPTCIYLLRSCSSLTPFNFLARFCAQKRSLSSMVLQMRHSIRSDCAARMLSNEILLIVASGHFSLGIIGSYRSFKLQLKLHTELSMFSNLLFLANHGLGYYVLGSTGNFYSQWDTLLGNISTKHFRFGL